MTSEFDEKNTTVVFPLKEEQPPTDSAPLLPPPAPAATNVLPAMAALPAPAAQPPAPAGGTQILGSPAPINDIPSRLQFLVRESGVIVEHELEKVLIIGRRNSSMPVDIDLADHAGQDLGISRNHLKIEIINKRLTIRDLESVNGTLLNGKQMKPHQPYELKHGDELKPGRMHLKVYFIHR
jgi:pSer/pThr/pTyr-binding forkhead associated (FHA) protein